MARNRKKKALYEVISKTPGYDGAVERLHPEEPGRDEQIEAKPAKTMSERVSQWPRRPRLVQFNAGRIELSMPYQLAIALLLGLVLLVLGVFRLGQISGVPKSADSGTIGDNIKQETPIGLGTEGTTAVSGSGEETTGAAGEDAEAVRRTGNNVIVLQEYHTHADLVPVRNHFAEYDIATEIVRENGRYFLLTKDRYDNPEKRGTDGYDARQRIIAVGALYEGKAPDGYETFAPNFFRGAYGKKVK